MAGATSGPMNDDMADDVTALGHVPSHQRHRVLHGMRWTVWLSALAVPFSAGTNLLLARIGPETIGVYGLLSVYIGLITAFLYFGGDTVVIRFIPECREEDRASFLVSYLLVILTLQFGCLVVAYFFPAVPRIVLGDGGGDGFRFFVVCLAPLPIAYWIVVASLKGMLDIRVSQILSKLVPISALIGYASLYLAARPLIVRYPFEVIWAVYLVPMAGLGTIGAIRVVRLCGYSPIRFYLPRGFWSYALATQQVGVAFFLAYRLDYVLVLNYGGLEVLGRYVAVMTVAGLVPMVNGFFMDTLLPSLTNMQAARNTAGAAQVFMMHMRILFLVATAMSCGIMVLAVAATSVMGAQYHSIQKLIILMAMVQGIASPAMAGGVLLASIGRQRLAIWSCGLHVVLLTGLFFVLWRHWGLTGEVIASAAAVMVSYGSMMVFAMWVAPHSRSIGGLWVRAACVDIAVGLIALWWMPLGLTAAALVWIGAMVLFLWLSGYDSAECRRLAQTFLPRVALRYDQESGAMVVGRAGG
jgi:O-antigen/teichoic acid export membrane protein